VLFDDGQLGGFASTALVEEELRFICASPAQEDSTDDDSEQSLTLAEAVQHTLILPSPCKACARASIA
jgi:LysR family nitrogen assimilation transcriptional regulator